MGPMLPAELARISHWVQMAGHAGSAGVLRGLTLLARHTGVPVTLVAAASLVISYRLARKAARLGVELALALVAVLAATKLGWIRW
jgi:hypothetical protein